MLRSIAWFNEATVEPLATGGLTSSDVTVCRRCLMPAREIEKLGIECSVFGNLHHADPTDVSRHLTKLQTDIVVIGKITAPAILKLARAAKHLGCYVVVDVADDTALPDGFAELAQLTDQMVTASDGAADGLEAHGFLSVIIPDCDEKNAGAHAPAAIARQWLDCFRKLQMKPPACANTNEPLASNG